VIQQTVKARPSRIILSEMPAKWPFAAIISPPNQHHRAVLALFPAFPAFPARELSWHSTYRERERYEPTRDSPTPVLYKNFLLSLPSPPLPSPPLPPRTWLTYLTLQACPSFCLQTPWPRRSYLVTLEVIESAYLPGSLQNLTVMLSPCSRFFTTLSPILTNLK
jgi:hypothetical protein